MGKMIDKNLINENELDEVAGGRASYANVRKNKDGD